MSIDELVKKIDEIEKNISEIKSWIMNLKGEENRDFLTVEEVRKKYKVGKNYLYWLCKNNYVENRYLNRKYYISEKSFIEYLNNSKKIHSEKNSVKDMQSSKSKVSEIENKLQEYLASIK
ncbi:helix-turn-helix domain-containing protein [Caldicellulosiruptor acetigenus]|uniref:helix-turn-helix domain-containing protein n=1 Tax=Caldicellulosiruptor acetigenus TaxID=301953 RepID=UPI0022A92E30|nr:helix-turn-helix domain-containing protein [Caldicellulosiruptor acetigenus]WAM36528.1 helix-turn-helix domain-containing protein [Caldicellulosiruptor acetigenus]